MAASLTELLKDLTPTGLLTDLLAVGKALGLSTTAWQPGEPIRGFAEVFCSWLAPQWNGTVLPALRALWLDYASGDWLTLGAWVMYGVHRKRESFATGPAITVENRAGGFWTINTGDIRFENADGKTFSNIDGGTLASWPGTGDYPELELIFKADEAGTDSDTPAGTISGVYPDVPVQAPGEGIYLQTNVSALVGQDEETDDELKERCRLSTGPLSPAGPTEAYQFVALSTRRPAADDPEPQRLLVTKEGDTAVNVNRCRVINAGGGVVNVRLASPAGEASGDVSTAGSDVYLANQAIQTLVVPIGITANVSTAAAQLQTIALSLEVLRESHVTAADAEAAAKAAVEVFFRTFPIGARALPSTSTRYLVMEEVRAIAKASIPGIYNVISTPSADVVVPITSVVVPTVTATATLVTQ
jgi:hypothetical protein